jgi:hypothetical protein
MGRQAEGWNPDSDVDDILEGGCPLRRDPPEFSERDVAMFHKALALEKRDCQELLRLMLYQGPKKFEDKAKVLAAVGFAKKATGWRDTWKRNRERIVAYIEAHRENS